MKKRNNKKTAAALASIMEDLTNQTGAKPPLQVVFKYDPETLIEILLSYSEDRISEILSDPQFQQSINPDAAREYAKRLKEAVNKAVEQKIQQSTRYYPLSRQMMRDTQNQAAISAAFAKLENEIFNPENLRIDSTGLTKAGKKVEHVFLALYNQASEAAADQVSGEDQVKRKKGDLSENYFCGNLPAVQLEIPFMDGQIYALAKYRCRIDARAAYRFYYGKKKVSKWDIENAEKSIREYSRVNFIHELKAEHEGRTFKKAIVSERMKIEPITEERTNAKGGKDDVVIFYDITLNAAFMTFKNGGSYTKTPEYKHLILEAAAGGAKSTHNLHYDLFDELNAQRLADTGEAEIVLYKIGLVKMLEKFGMADSLGNRHKSRFLSTFEKVCNDLQRAGLLRKVKSREGLNGEIICEFEINRHPIWIDWQRG